MQSSAACQFDDVLPFLQSNTNSSPATTTRLLQLLDDRQQCTYLQLELAAVIDCSEKIVMATYELEGDEPQAL